MAFFDKLGETISAASSTVAQKTKEMTEINNLNRQISTNESLIQNTYLEIGKACFETNRNNSESPYYNLCKTIENSQVAIAGFQEQIRTLKGSSLCPNCGTQLPKESVFCQSCGYQVTTTTASAAQQTGAENTQGVQPVQNVQPVQPIPVASNFCVGCGSEMQEGTAFCTNCGQKKA